MIYILSLNTIEDILLLPSYPSRTIPSLDIPHFSSDQIQAPNLLQFTMSFARNQKTAYIKFVNNLARGCYPCIIQNESIVWQGDEISGYGSMTIRLNDPQGPGAHFPRDGVTCNIGFKLDPVGHDTSWTHDNPVTYAWNGNTAVWGLNGEGGQPVQWYGNND